MKHCTALSEALKPHNVVAEPVTLAKFLAKGVVTPRWILNQLTSGFVFLTDAEKPTLQGDKVVGFGSTLHDVKGMAHQEAWALVVAAEQEGRVLFPKGEASAG